MDENEIRQQLLFDAEQAIKEMERASSAFDGFGERLDDFAERIVQFNARTVGLIHILQQIGAAARDARSALGGIAGASLPSVPSSGGGGGGGGNGGGGGGGSESNRNAWLLTPQTFSRVIQTQMFIRGLNEVRDAFVDSTRAALEFSRQVGEIRAISPERTFGQISDEVRRLSDAFNQPIAKVAEAEYQALSNQFTSTSDRLQVLSASNELAKTTAQELDKAVLLVTGALNAYGEGADKAELRASQFFKAIELGRIRMGELGTALGRVQGIAAEAGISAEELTAALVSITIGGVKATEASTQLRGVISAFLKPSQDMKTAFHELGVESGEAAIATWGLQGAIAQLWKLAGETPTGMAKFFPNIRGDAGALRMATEGAEKYHKAFREINTPTGIADFQARFKEFTETDAEKLTKELNKIKNFFDTEFGPSLVKNLGWIFQGTDHLIPAFRALSSVAIPAAGAVGVMSAALMTLALRAQLAQAGMTGLGKVAGGVALVGGAVALGEFIGEELSAHIAAPYEREWAEMEKTLKHYDDVTSAKIKIADEADTERGQALLQQIAQYQKLYLLDADNLKDALKVEEQVTKAALDRMLAQRQKMTREMFAESEKAAKKAEEELPQTIKAREEARRDRELEERFHPTPGLEEVTGHRPFNRPFLVAKEELERRLKQAFETQAGAKDAEQEKEAQYQWKRAEAAAKREMAVAQEEKDFSRIRWAYEDLELLDKRHTEALKEQVTVQRQVAKETEQRGHQAERHNLELDEISRQIEDKLKATTRDQQGGARFKTGEELKRDLSQADKLIDTYSTKYREYGKQDFGKAIMGDPKAFQSLRREAERALASQDFSRVLDSTAIIRDFYGRLREEAGKITLHVKVIGHMAELMGMDLVSSTPSQVEAAYRRRAGEMQAAQVQSAQLDLKDKDLVAKFEDHLITAFQATAGVKHADAFESLLHEVSDMVHSGKPFDNEKLADWRDRALEAFNESFTERMWHPAAYNEADKAMSLVAKDVLKLLETRNQEQKVQGTLKDSDWIKQWEAVQAERREIEVQAIDKQTSAIEGNSARLQALTDAWQRASEHPGEMVPVAAHCYGGYAHLADGGPIGSDIIPAMLSPGEFVVNAASVRKFAAQLVAMNAGTTPTFRSESNVTNIGDINVTVQGGGSSRQTARSIATELRRELRRGTAIL